MRPLGFCNEERSASTCRKPATGEQLLLFPDTVGTETIAITGARPKEPAKDPTRPSAASCWCRRLLLRGTATSLEPTPTWIRLGRGSDSARRRLAPRSVVGDHLAPPARNESLSCQSATLAELDVRRRHTLERCEGRCSRSLRLWRLGVSTACSQPVRLRSISESAGPFERSGRSGF
jgi:hypothetical protein